MRAYKQVYTLLVIVLCAATAGGNANTIAPVPPSATRRAATVQVHVVPDHADWHYKTGEPARFHIRVTADNMPLSDVKVTCKTGPELMPAEEKAATLSADGLSIEGGVMKEPGFLRCLVTAEFGKRTYRGLATAAYEPKNIKPTQAEPEDFDRFWTDGLNELAAVPMEPEVTLLPELCTSKVKAYHVSFRVTGPDWLAVPARMHGILCEPAAPGHYPALLKVPGAGVRPYTGEKSLAERGMITLEIGIHGIPVNLPKAVYDQLYAGALNSYSTFNMDKRADYYFRRVYLGCVRANDFLVSRSMWDGKSLIVMGGSQGGMLSIVTAALDPRVTGLNVTHPAGCDVTGDLHGRAGGWPRPFAPHSKTGRPSPNTTAARIATSAYYDVVNFARRVKVPGHYAWGLNDEVCPPTSMHAAYNVIAAPKELTLLLEIGHNYPPELWDANVAWLADFLGLP
jgi:cephalosporin-C deacetylase-like acetyl esterase